MAWRGLWFMKEIINVHQFWLNVVLMGAIILCVCGVMVREVGGMGVGQHDSSKGPYVIIKSFIINAILEKKQTWDQYHTR